MKLKATVLLSTLVMSGAVLAQAKAPEPDFTSSLNVGGVTDYRYRGISQSRGKPAIQGGADVAHKSGFYIGTWASSIKWIKDGGGDTSAEVDIYGGYKFSSGDFAFDLGALRYLYPGSTMGVNPDTTEIYAAGTWGPVTLKYSHAVTNLFGFSDSDGSYYVDLNATFDTGVWGLAFVPHVGYQKVKSNDAFSYTDWSLTLNKDFGNGFSASLAYVDTDTKTYIAPNGKDLGKATAVLGVKYTYAF
ncbi:TorF family putative porin [uncultured Ramlibacter sp.]|uniref:TorF family putative porin n=1 Tax=uncultured Ramlibacter sp. TaxID=260755 RepID=UPI00262DCF98|nr:TorF family putative porin [uncultured Ramlibacter sp.]